MRRLHLQLYLAIVGTLLAFSVSGSVIWYHLASPQGSVWGIESATGLAAVMLNTARGAERQAEVIDSLAHQLHANVALFDAPGRRPLVVSGYAMSLTHEEITGIHWQITTGGPTYNLRFDDGRHLVVQPRHRFLLHGLHMGLLLTGIAVVLALLTYPITRGITARLGRLQAGVLQFGAGDLGVRVPVEGRDEVATLAKSFNESAGRIEQLVRAHQLLLANCSHELRTPLARIRLGVERVPDTDPKVSAELARSIAELDALIGEMLLSSRLEAARGIERAEPVDLLALVAEEAAHFDREASGAAVIIQGDALLLRRLVRNLLDNARAHAGGATDIRIERDEQSARVVVEDAGPGVPESDRERIFEPFYRAQMGAQMGSQPGSQPGSQSAARPGGAGLGLSIVRQIARAHAGNVEYTPRVGGGSRFTVTLPR